MFAPKKSRQPTIVEERVLNFLQRVPPFQFLEISLLNQIVTQVEIHYFPQGTLILSPEMPPADYLYVIERGGVKKSLLTELNEEKIIEVAGEGDFFGILSNLEENKPGFQVTALADTICYAIPQQLVQELLISQPLFARYLLHFSIGHYLDRSLNKVRQADFSNNNHRLLFTGQAPHHAPGVDRDELARQPLVTCAQTTTIQTAAQLMSAKHIGSIVVTDPTGQAIGIVTNWDLRERVVAAGWDVLGAIEQIMSTPLRTISGDTPIYEVAGLMMTHHIHHLVVSEAQRPVGMITSHDLVMLQSTSTLSIGREIDRQTNLSGLRRTHEHGQQIIPILLHQGVRAGQLGQMMANLNDRLVIQTIKLIEAGLDPPPAPYCWLVLGSEGRREQTFKTDQDNALIYATPPLEMADLCRTYFLEFGQQVIEALVKIGFPPCPGNFMASNPQWVQPLTGWQTQFSRWVTSWDPTELVEAMLFFDLRGIYGDLTLVDQLHNFITQLMSETPHFLRQLAHLSTRQSPPLGFLGQFTLESSGEHKNEFDLKRQGTVPIADLARFFALQHNLSPTNTLKRLDLLKTDNHLPPDLADALAQAYEFLLSLRIEQEWEQLSTGQVASPYLNPNQLSVLDRRLLREACRVIGQAQGLLKKESRHRAGWIL